MDKSELVFMKSLKGKPVLLNSGYRYNFVTRNKSGSTYWRCHMQKKMQYINNIKFN